MEWGFDIDDPSSMRAWESSAVNVYRSKIIIMNFVFLGGHFDKPEAITAWDMKPFPVEACGWLDAQSSQEQCYALEQLVVHEKAIYKQLRDALYVYYENVIPELRDALSAYITTVGVGEPGALDELLPTIRSGHELDQLVECSHIRALRPRDGMSKIGMLFDCRWDPEHGLGALISGSTVESFGASDVAYAAD